LRHIADPSRWQIWAIALVIAVAFFGYLLPSRHVFYGGDTARLYLPQQRALSSALQNGQLPWWSPDIGAGYPLLAEGEAGALYPVNLALHLLFTPEVSLTVGILLHLFLAGLGTALLAQTLGVSRGAALLSAVVYALGGFIIAHTSHVSIVSVSAWLPWLLMLLHRAVLAPGSGRRALYSVALGTAIAFQFLAGHAQMSLIILLPLLAWTGYLVLTSDDRGTVARRLLLPAVGIVLGTAAAAPQMLATLELAGLSQRAGGLDSVFFTSYSFHPGLTATFVSPFVLGSPYPAGTIELMGYVGLLPLALSGIALSKSQGGTRWLLAGLGVCGLLLAFGRWNPVYTVLERIPPFNLFRVPARYLLWTSLALALLSALGLDSFAGRLNPRRAAGTLSGVLCVALALTVIIVTLRAEDADALVAAWRWLPLLNAAALVIWLLGSHQQTRGALFRLALIILCADLYAYGAVLRLTYSQSWPVEDVRAAPEILEYLPSDGTLYRVWTKESIMPALSVQREALYPNIGAAYGIASANMYMPLVPRAYQEYVSTVDASRLDRMNVRYYVIPQLLPVDQASELYDVLNPFAALPYGVTHSVALGDVAEVQVESYVSHGADMADGVLAATLVLESGDSQVHRFPIRVGIETAEWAIERSDVAATVRHSMPPLASTFPARSSYRNTPHPGHTYLAKWTLATPLGISSLRIEAALPEAYVRIERIRFVTSDGQEVLASDLMGLGDYAIVYRSEDALVYENRDVWPRAYTVPLVRTVETEGAYALDGDLDASLLGTVTVNSYGNLRVDLEATVAVPSLLVLGDMAYPDWKAHVDGAAATIAVVDGLFRGVVLTPGSHQVVFEYRP
jgi:hypothetical protein